jgi:hypothetical protein
VVAGDIAERAVADAPVATAPLERLCLADAAASRRDRGLSGAQRSRLLGAFGVAADGKFRFVLPLAWDLHRTRHAGGDRV